MALVSQRQPHRPNPESDSVEDYFFFFIYNNSCNNNNQDKQIKGTLYILIICFNNDFECTDTTQLTSLLG
jgi:hypothetical protein